MDGIYFINDTKEHIRRVQLWLREISRSDERIKPVFIDGIYGDETREAVRNVQKVYGLAVTGELDKETFDLIFRLYSDLLSLARVDGFRPKFEQYDGETMSPGDVYDDIFVLQLLLRELSLKDERFFVQMSGRFDPETEIAVKLLQKLLRVTEDGKVTRTVWNSLIALTEQTEGYL